MTIDGHWISDSFDLLDGELLTPEEDEEGYTPDKRYFREVFISGGIYNERYGGPEEGGWWYDSFDPQIEIVMYPKSEQQLIDAIRHVIGLVMLRSPWEDVKKGFIIRPDHFFMQQREHYE